MMNRIQILTNATTRFVMSRTFCTNNGGNNDAKTAKNIELPPEPTTCCMSGCQNCVWVQYANELTKLLDDGGEQAREIVLKKITDPNLKVFLQIELQNLDSAKKESLSD